MFDWIRDANSHDVLWGQTVVYTAYCLAIISVVAWVALKLTKPESRIKISPKVFYSWVAFLVVLGGGLHLITYGTIPWVKDDLHAGSRTVAPENVFDIAIGDHQWQIPAGSTWVDGNTPLAVPCDELVKFRVKSEDLTYGFGVFRQNASMVTQMQVLPGHDNDLLWKFTEDGTFNIRSTEYSGPAGHNIIARDAIVVTGCGKAGPA
jgi:cytochrome c oxidase subunit 2